MTMIDIPLPGGEHSIHLEAGIAASAGQIAREVAPHHRAILIVDANVQPTIGQAVRASVQDAGYEAIECPIDAAEPNKSLATVEAIYARMLEARLERRSPVFGVGGGLTGDIAGFVAATYLRGVPLIHVPTTLLAMVDASIGGKTGVNHPLPRGGVGKNLIGAFWQPRAIITDPQALCTLDDRQLRAGIAECIKHAVIADATLFDTLESARDEVLSRDPEALQSLIEQSARIKVRIVVQDERESGVRALLNLGHTFGHAIEPRRELSLNHGEAVAIGLCAAARVAADQGLIDRDDERRIVDLIASWGLPTRLKGPAPVEELMETMGYDKKVSSGAIRLVLPAAIGRAVIRDDVALDPVREAWRAVGAM